MGELQRKLDGYTPLLQHLKRSCGTSANTRGKVVIRNHAQLLLASFWLSLSTTEQMRLTSITAERDVLLVKQAIQSQPKTTPTDTNDVSSSFEAEATQPQTPHQVAAETVTLKVAREMQHNAMVIDWTGHLIQSNQKVCMDTAIMADQGCLLLCLLLFETNGTFLFSCSPFTQETIALPLTLACIFHRQIVGSFCEVQFKSSISPNNTRSRLAARVQQKRLLQPINKPSLDYINRPWSKPALAWSVNLAQTWLAKVATDQTALFTCHYADSEFNQHALNYFDLGDVFSLRSAFRSNNFLDLLIRSAAPNELGEPCPTPFDVILLNLIRSNIITAAMEHAERSAAAVAAELSSSVKSPKPQSINKSLKRQHKSTSKQEKKKPSTKKLDPNPSQNTTTTTRLDHATTTIANSQVDQPSIPSELPPLESTHQVDELSSCNSSIDRAWHYPLHMRDKLCRPLLKLHLRPRQKHAGLSVVGVVTKLREQLEFYFSLSNLRSDYYLVSRMDLGGYVCLKELAGFPRVVRLLGHFEHVADRCQLLGIAVRSSVLLELDDPVVAIKVRPIHFCGLVAFFSRQHSSVLQSIR